MITKGTTTKYTPAYADSATIPVNLTGYYRALVITVNTENTSGTPPTVTVGGVTATLATNWNVAGGLSFPFYWTYICVNPPQGSSNIVITSSAAFLGGDVYILPLNGVDQSNPINISGVNAPVGNNSTPATLTLVTTVDGCLPIASVFAYTSTRTFSDGTYIDLYNNNSNFDFGSGPTPIGTAGSYALSCAISGSSQKLMFGFMAAPAALLSILQSTTISNIGLYTATATSAVDYDGDVTITERGFVLDTNVNPTILKTKVVASGTTGSYSSNITSLTPNTTYYIRSFATNSYGTAYGAETSFTTNNIASNEVIKNINAISGGVYAVSLNVTGSLGNVTVQLGRTGTSATFTAGSGVQTMQGAYSGSDGLIITRSGTFNGTIDDLLWVRVNGSGTIDWTKTNFTTVFPISSSVFFKRIEDDIFNSFRLYRYLDLLFKDFDGYVTVTLRSERNDAVYTKERTFSVGNTSNPASPFSKKRISFLCKDQAIIIGLSNASLNETFAIAKFVLSGHKRPRKGFDSDRIVSVA